MNYNELYWFLYLNIYKSRSTGPWLVSLRWPGAQAKERRETDSGQDGVWSSELWFVQPVFCSNQIDKSRCKLVHGDVYLSWFDQTGMLLVFFLGFFFFVDSHRGRGLQLHFAAFGVFDDAAQGVDENRPPRIAKRSTAELWGAIEVDDEIWWNVMKCDEMWWNVMKCDEMWWNEEPAVHGWKHLGTKLCWKKSLWIHGSMFDVPGLSWLFSTSAKGCRGSSRKWSRKSRKNPLPA